MALETYGISSHDLIAGIALLLIGLLVYGLSPRLPQGTTTIGAIIGGILAIIGIILIVLAFLQ